MSILSTEAMARLHRLITWKSPSVISASATTGEACVWCGGPLGEDAARLGWGSCYGGRRAWYVTWYDWHQHVRRCVPCQQAHVCLVGYGLRSQHEITREAAGKDDTPHCVSCNHPIHAAELIVPVRWEGTSQDHLGYGHPQCLMSRATVR
ncbi:MAG: hypothetical protein HOY79_01715 [Streptomyces sp.]|nr:hypothetical protein [Streptomyces sp.]